MKTAAATEKAAAVINPEKPVLVSIRKVSEEPGRNFPTANGNLSRFSILSAIACNSCVFCHNEFFHEGRTVRFRKAPARLFLKRMEFSDENYLTTEKRKTTMSPRLKKPRSCNCPYRGDAEAVYKPAGTPLRDLEKITIGHDEMEAMFLCDAENLTQEEAGIRMGVSRGTVQRLIAQARKKTIETIGLGKALMVEGRETK